MEERADYGSGAMIVIPARRVAAMTVPFLLASGARDTVLLAPHLRHWWPREAGCGNYWVDPCAPKK
jgi:hypothetical protein